MTKNEKILYDELLTKSWIAHPGKTISTNKLKNVMIAEIRLETIRMNDLDEIPDPNIPAHRDHCYTKAITLLAFLYYNLRLLTNEDFEYLKAKLDQAYINEVYKND